MRHNMTHAEIILEASITENKTDDSNLVIENINAPATTTKENLSISQTENKIN